MSEVWVFAADTIVRFRGGRILLHTSSSRLPAFVTDNPILTGWLCQFAQPIDPNAAIARLPPADQTRVKEILEYLKRSGAVVRAGSAETAEPTVADVFGRARNHLRALARTAYELSCDLNGVGLDADKALEQKSGIGVERRLMAVLSAMDALRAELAQQSAEALSSQLAQLRIDANSRDLKLHIGCAKVLLPDWINIDIHPAPLAMNVLRGLPFADGSSTYVFVSHMLEHLYFPRDVRPFLADLRRVLAPGGVLRIIVPDIEQCIEAYTTQDREFFASRRETWPWWPENPTRLEDFLAYAGVGPEPGYLFESHKYGYDFETLAKVLHDAGFSDVRRSTYMASEHPELRVDDVSAVARATYGSRYYSLFVEARHAG